jgi:monoamine oxidase
VRVAVIGAGFAGLACAADLAQSGADVTVYERRDRVGGRVWTGSMPDGGLTERGGEFVETGYDHMLRRAREHGLAAVPQGFEFAGREVRAEGTASPELLAEAAGAVAATVDAMGAEAHAISASEAIDRTPLGPLARRALTRRLTGTYTVALERVSASWLAAAGARADGAAGEIPSSRLAAGNDALARAMAAALGERILLDCAVDGLRAAEDGVTVTARGSDARYDRAVLAVPLPVARDSLLPHLQQRSSYVRLQWGMAAKLHVPLAAPAAPAAVQGLEASFWTWTARTRNGGDATFSSSFAGGAEALSALAVHSGSDDWVAAVQRLRPELRHAGAPVLTVWGPETAASGGSYSCHPPGWSRADDEELAAPLGRVHLAGEHTAGDFCGTMEGALRSGARAAAEALAADGAH